MTYLKLVSLGVLLHFVASVPAFSHVRQRQFTHSSKSASSGVESLIRWDPATPIKVSMHSYSGGVGSGATENAALTFSVTRSLVGASLSQWTSSLLGLAPGLTLDLDSAFPYSYSSACETLPGTTSQDGFNYIVFTSKLDASCGTALTTGSGVIGVTKVRYRSDNGLIVEADLQLDDVSFYFKTSGANNLTSTPKEINLNDVVVHELGHFFGLDHTSIRTSTMLFAVAENMQTPKSDDKLGVLSLYPPSGGLGSAFGSLKGSVVDSSSNPIFGAVVFAINARSLEVVASEITNPDGAFEFCALPPGPYVVYTNRYTPFGTNIHAYYSGNGQSRNGSYVNSKGTELCYNPSCKLITETLTHTWWSKVIETSGAIGGLGLRVLPVTAGTTSEFLNLVGSSTPATLVDVPSGTTDVPANVSVIVLDEPRVARLSASTLPIEDPAPPDAVGTDNYKFTLSQTTKVRIATNSLGIFTRLKINLELFASNDIGGDDLADNTVCTANTGNQATATVSTAADPKLICDLSPGSYVVRVTGTSADCNLIPGNASTCVSSGAGDSATTNIPYYLIAVVDESTVADASAEHPSTETLDTTTSATADFPGMPTCSVYSATVGTPEDSAGSKSAVCCGNIRQIPGGPSGPKSFLLAVLLNPAFLFGAYWMARSLKMRLLIKRN